MKVAYNHTTGEVIICQRSNQLKRIVRQITSWDHKYWPTCKHEWYFGSSQEAIYERLKAAGKLK